MKPSQVFPIICGLAAITLIVCLFFSTQRRAIDAQNNGNERNIITHVSTEHLLQAYNHATGVTVVVTKENGNVWVSVLDAKNNNYVHLLPNFQTKN